MSNSIIKYYPVGNGDMTLLALKDGKSADQTILIDCNIRECAKGDDDKTKFDAKDDLLKSIKKRDNNPFIDVFVLTHGDEDHCRGFKKNFYQGDPQKYSAKNRDANEIIIDEMWFSPMIAELATNEDEDVIQSEAERRLKLHREKDSNRNLPGNRILIIGYDGNKKYEDLDHLRYIPGNIITEINTIERKTFSVFIHAPYKQQLQDSEKDKNHTSIVFQARFKAKENDSDFSCLAMFSGDGDHHAWKIILEKTKKYENDVKEKALKWDLFLAPHHCSWTFFNDTPQTENKDPQKDSLEVLDNKRSNAKVIASSKEIFDDDDNPPHYAAKKEYVNKVTASKFINTETYKLKGKTPQPIIFEITSQGPVPPKEEEGGSKGAGGASLGAINTPSTYGSTAF